jgi:hypothetical protein
MQRFLLMFVLYATIVVPTWLSRDPKPARGMKRTVMMMFVLTVLWAYACKAYYFRLADD